MLIRVLIWDFSRSNDLQAIELSVDESSFTGETQPANKSAEPVINTGDGSSIRNVCFMGTLVRCGSGKVSTILALDIQ